MMDRANDCQLVGVPGQSRHVLADSNAWHGRGNRLELAAIFRRRARLRIPGFVMAHSAPAVQDNAGLGPAVYVAMNGTRIEIVREGESQSADAAVQELPSRCETGCHTLSPSGRQHLGVAIKPRWEVGPHQAWEALQLCRVWKRSQEQRSTPNCVGVAL